MRIILIGAEAAAIRQLFKTLENMPGDHTERKTSSAGCPAEPGCTFLGEIHIGDKCFCTYDCGESILFTACP